MDELGASDGMSAFIKNTNKYIKNFNKPFYRKTAYQEYSCEAHIQPYSSFIPSGIYFIAYNIKIKI
jgi:hypothetical protein